MAEKARGFAANLWKRGREVAKQQAQILPLQGQIVRLRDQKSRLHVQMGQKVYALFEKELIKNADLLAFCEQIRGIDEEIARKEQEIETIRKSDDAEAPAGSESTPGASPATGAPTGPTDDAPQEHDPWYAFVRGEEPDAPTPEAPPGAGSAPDAPDASTRPDAGQETSEPSQS
jgi:hypothetical protein